MGALADATLGAGGTAIGVIPRGLAAREIAHGGLTELRVVASMHERKAEMARLADAFVALPGGFGTLEELLEVVTWAQLGIHRKPIGLLNVAGYYDALIALVGRGVADGFIPTENSALVVVETEPRELLERLAAYERPPSREWMGPDET
jgi:hypothetical protein